MSNHILNHKRIKLIIRKDQKLENLVRAVKVSHCVEHNAILFCFEFKGLRIKIFV